MIKYKNMSSDEFSYQLFSISNYTLVKEDYLFVSILHNGITYLDGVHGYDDTIWDGEVFHVVIAGDIWSFAIAPRPFVRGLLQFIIQYNSYRKVNMISDKLKNDEN